MDNDNKVKSEESETRFWMSKLSQEIKRADKIRNLINEKISYILRDDTDDKTEEDEELERASSPFAIDMRDCTRELSGVSDAYEITLSRIEL